jgi:hypothetical protein
MSSRALQDLLLQSRAGFGCPAPSCAHVNPDAPKLVSQEVVDRIEQRCPLCSKVLTTESLGQHLDMCDQNLISCPHCSKGVALVQLDDHVQHCPSNFRSCYVCQSRISSCDLPQHLQTCGRGKVIRMFHGTSLVAARSIMKEGFRASTKGLLGAGVYVTKDPCKAQKYGPVIIECDVHVGTVAVINRRHHNFQKCWGAHGFDCAWIPPQCGVVSTGMEEHCVGDPHRVVALAMTSAIETKKQP